jgi:hypothetical protein
VVICLTRVYKHYHACEEDTGRRLARVYIGVCHCYSIASTNGYADWYAWAGDWANRLLLLALAFG